MFHLLLLIMFHRRENLDRPKISAKSFKLVHLQIKGETTDEKDKKIGVGKISRYQKKIAYIIEWALEQQTEPLNMRQTFVSKLNDYSSIIFVGIHKLFSYSFIFGKQVKDTDELRRTTQNSIDGCNDYVISLALRNLPPASVKPACTPGFRKVCGSCVACVGKSLANPWEKGIPTNVSHDHS